MKNKKTIISIIVMVLGGIAGYLYWNSVGCNESCGIWSSPWRSAGMGALIAYLGWNAIADLFFKKQNKNEVS